MAFHLNTPLIQSLALPAKSRIWLKMDALQPCGSFKIRGMGFACEQYARQGAKGFVCSSGGNAGLAVAFAARQLGIPAKVVVPVTTGERAKVLLKQEGAEVQVQGESWQEAHEFAQTLLEEDWYYLHPFDDPLLWQGHSSIIDEVIEAGVKPDAIVVAVGGGGLLSGVLLGLEKANLKDTAVFAVETEGAGSLSLALKEQRLASLDAIDSIATSLGAKQVCEQAFVKSQQWPVQSVLVSDQQAVDACKAFADDHRVLVEPACGAALSVVYDQPKRLEDFSDVLVVVCGGAGVSLAQFN